LSKERENHLAEHSEVKSENARNVILSYGENVYFVNKVNVQVNDGAEKLKAVFHARRLPNNEPEDLDIEINQRVYDMLTEYAKLDKLDLILVLQIQGEDAKWCLMSENWLKNQSTSACKTVYIV
jgi:hypothetical protein